MKIFKNFLEKFYKIIFPIIAVALIVIVWQIAAVIVDAEIIIPLPFSTIKEFFNVLGEQEFYVSVCYTLIRAVIGFLISFLIAFITAYFSHKFKYVRAFMKPFTVISRGVPTMSIILLCWLVLTPKIAPVFIIVIVLFPLCYSEFLSEFSSLDKSVLEACKVYKVDKRKVLKKYVLPEILEKSFLSAITQLAYSVKLTVSAEAVLQTMPSLGLLMQVSKANLETGRLLAYTLVAIILGCILELIAVIVKRKIMKKRGAV